MIFREANSDDIGGLFGIWTACFTDDYPYIENYFKYCFPYTKTLVAITDSGEIASSITLIPATARIDKKIIKGYYLYAVGTKPEHRGFSLSSSLINIAKQICRNENLSFLITKPATDSLYDLYQRYGFICTLYEEQHIETIDSSESHSEKDTPHTSLLHTIPLTLDFFEESRYVSTNKFLWSREVLNYILLETALKEGFCVTASRNEDSSQFGYFIISPEAGNIETILVLETNIEESDFSYVYKTIKNQYPKAKAVKIIRPNSDIANVQNLKRSGLLLPITEGVDTIIRNFSILLPME
ncbi:MAG: GNAT family N-acetyltransferase [Bacteroidales bacterium]|nr:GNAT family N-acetyltransferase [Bacteroidales bacterium]